MYNTTVYNYKSLLYYEYQYLIESWNVQIIDKEDELFSERRTKNTLI